MKTNAKHQRKWVSIEVEYRLKCREEMDKGIAKGDGKVTITIQTFPDVGYFDL